MNYSKSDNKLNLKDYLFLAVCLFVIFIVRLFLIEDIPFPEGNELIQISIALLICIPLGIYILKKMNDY